MTLLQIFLLLFVISSCFFFTSIEGRLHGNTKPKHLHIVSHISLPPASAPAPAPQPAVSPSYNTNSPSPNPTPSPTTLFNVLSFGAVGDGAIDDTQAFKMAWDNACQSESAILLAPLGYFFMIQPTIFTGPCKSALVFQVILVNYLVETFQYKTCNWTLILEVLKKLIGLKLHHFAGNEKIDGTIMPPDGPESWPRNINKRQWLVFYKIRGMSMQGGGAIDGRGEKWWNLPCKPHKVSHFRQYIW